MQYREYRDQVREFINTARTTYALPYIEKGVQKPFLQGMFNGKLICCPIGAAMYPIYRDDYFTINALIKRSEHVIYFDFSESYPFAALHVPHPFCEKYIPNVISHGSYTVRTIPLWRLIYLLNDYGAGEVYGLPQIEAVLYHAYSHLVQSDNL